MSVHTTRTQDTNHRLRHLAAHTYTGARTPGEQATIAHLTHAALAGTITTQAATDTLAAIRRDQQRHEQRHARTATA